MAQVNVGDTVYFTSVSILVNEGTVEAIEGPYLKIKTKGPEKYVMASQAFPTAHELRQSSVYHAAWFAKQQREQRRSITSMASLWR